MRNTPKQESTCFPECRYRDKKGKYKKTCPDYVELSWQADSGKVCVTEDCARRRTMLMMLNMDIRLVGVQQASEQERNANHKLIGKIGEIITSTRAKKQLQP